MNGAYLVHEAELGGAPAQGGPQDDDDVVQIVSAPYRITHHIVYNVVFGTPQYGVLLYDQHNNRPVTNVAGTTSVLATYSTRPAPANDDPRALFLTADQHPHDDMTMFFVHCCGTDAAISPVVEGHHDDYLLCYLSTYGPDVCCFAPWPDVQRLRNRLPSA